MQIRKSKHIPLATSEARNAVLSANKREQRLQVAMWQIAWWEGPEHSWQVRLMLVALGGYQGVFHRNRHSVLGFARPVVDANAEYYEETTTEDTAPIWMASCHFFPPCSIHTLQPRVSNSGQRSPRSV